MDIEQLRDYCIAKPEVEECFPFGPDNLVYKIRGKIFFISSLDKQPIQFNVKCDPEKAIELREQYPAISPGYHMNKKLWNTIIIDGSLSWKQIKSFIDESYRLVVEGKKK